ncbi:glycosyltransferase [Clostridium sp. MT-14]|uniref:tetratricopeptide repeat-containing glycosyltransferase family 2 protein n=1 Tax=Clostridium sp. MT-14 TaxID=3348360 RepID=UPI0035F4C1AC
MKLSICMMVKDEEKNLPRCLESLKPILTGLDSELIIVDTGSSDDTVKVAQKYTDKIYFHRWDNDFSGMRNVTISYAKGEWIFIIDADESVEDCSEILVFLNSKYTDKYNCCNLSVKSITDEEKQDYVLSTSPRIFRNDGYFHYEGKVHNEPVFRSPVLTLGTVLVHTGYISTDKELMNRKFERTSCILKRELEKNPENIYYAYQLSVSYSMHKDFKKALEQIERAYEIFSRKQLKKADYIYLYYQLVVCNLESGEVKNYKKAEKYCIEGIKIEDQHIDLYFCLAKVYMLMNKYEKAIEEYLKYFELVDDYDNLRIRYNGLVEIYSINRKDEGYYDIAAAYFKLCDYSNCIKYANKINSEKYLKRISQFSVQSFFKETDFVGLRELYKKVLDISDKNFTLDFLNVIENNLINLDRRDYLTYLKYFSQYNDTYCFLNKIRKMYENGQHNYGSMITQFANDFSLSDQPNYFGDFVYFMMKSSGNIYGILSKVSMNKVEEFIVYVANKYDDFSDTVYDYVIKNTGSDFKVIRINRLLERFILVLDKLDQKQYRVLFQDYIGCGINYVSMIYSNQLLGNEMIYDVKSDEDVFFIFMNKADEVKDYDEKEYIIYLRKALAAYPFMKKGIEMLLGDFEKKFNKKNDELESYKLKVKNTIKALIDNDKLNEADRIIDEYEQIVKDDLEIVLFKSKISLRRLNKVNTNYKM